MGSFGNIKRPLVIAHIKCKRNPETDSFLHINNMQAIGNDWLKKGFLMEMGSIL